MLARYFVRPQTRDHIRALWLGPIIEQYVGWLTERRIASRHVLRCVATLEHFNTFAQGRGVQTWEELPAHLGAFVEQRLRDRGAWCRSPKDRRTVLSQARTPVEQMLRLLIPGFIGTTTRRPVPFQETAADFFDYLRQERGLRPATLYQVDADVPFKVIGDYVGHRSADSIQVYGKVAVHVLRQLALGDGEEAL